MMTAIEGASQIEMARILAVRSALRLEILGMKRHGRSARVLANEIMGTSHSTAKKAYADLNARIASVLGPSFNKPLKQEGENSK
jgi:hypothetical protein